MLTPKKRAHSTFNLNRIAREQSIFSAEVLFRAMEITREWNEKMFVIARRVTLKNRLLMCSETVRTAIVLRRRPGRRQFSMSLLLKWEFHLKNGLFGGFCGIDGEI